MKGRQAAVVLGAFLGALATQGLSAGDNDRAVPRGGGSSGGSSGGGGSQGSSGGSSATSRHPGSSHSGSSSSSSSGGSSYSGSSGGSSHSGQSATPRTDAQRRHPRPGTGTGYYQNGYHGGYYPYYPYYRPYYYSYWPYDFYWGYGYFSPWYYPGYYGGGFYAGFGYPYGGPYVGGAYYGGGGGLDRIGSMRVIVEPNKTKVYVDEYYAGTVDDFDGIFQRLNLKPGAHDLTLKLDGYETHKIKVYVPLDHTLKIKHKMVRGSPANVTESVIGDPADAERYARLERDRREEYEQERDAYERERAEPEDREPPRERTDPSGRGGSERGTIRLDVNPVDASIYVDGMFRGTGQDLRRLSLPAGRHRLEVVRPGYQTLERDVEVQPGEIETVEVDLPRP